MRYSSIVIALSSSAFALGLAPRPAQCCYKQLVTVKLPASYRFTYSTTDIYQFDQSQGTTPASSFVAKDFETRGIKFFGGGVAAFPEGVNVGIEPKSKPSTWYYGLNSGVGNGGTPGMTTSYDASPFSTFMLESFWGGCTFAFTNIPVVPTRCIMTFIACNDICANPLGQESFTFPSQAGLQQDMLKMTFSTLAALNYNYVLLQTDFEAQVGMNWVKLSDLTNPIPNGPKPKVGATAFLDDIQMTVTPKECATCAA